MANNLGRFTITELEEDFDLEIDMADGRVGKLILTIDQLEELRIDLNQLCDGKIKKLLLTNIKVPD